MRIFVTGGTGFVGSHFLKLALTEGHEIIGLRREESSPRIALQGQLSWVEKPLGKVSISDLRNCDALVHFAAHGVSPQPTTWFQAFQFNVTDSLSLITAAVEAGVPRLVACGSCVEYGKSGELYDAIPSSAPLAPIGPYATSKAAFSLAFEALARTSESTFTLLRPFHLYGEGQHESNFWPQLREAALTGKDFPMSLGEQLRDYMPVEKAAERFLKEATLTEPQTSNFRVSNVGSGEEVSLRDFARKWWTHFEAQGKLQLGAIPYRKTETMRFIPEL